MYLCTDASVPPASARPLSIFMAAVAVKTFQNETNAGKLFFSFYIFLFSLLMCCFEVQFMSFIANFIGMYARGALD